MQADLKKYIDRKNITFTDNMQATAKLVYYAASGDKLKTILNVLPGLGKSTAATCLMSSDIDNQYLIVKRNVKDCLTQQADLLEIGVNPDDIALMCAYAEKHDICQIPRFHGTGYKMENCLTCSFNRSKSRDGRHIPMADRCPIGQTCCNRKEQMVKRIIVLTHKRFTDWWQLGRVPADRTIIIDESLSTYETVIMPKYELERLGKHEPGIKAHFDYLNKNIIEDCQSDGFYGNRPDNQFISIDEMEALRNLHAKAIIIEAEEYTQAEQEYPDPPQNDPLPSSSSINRYLSAFGGVPDETSFYVFDNEKSFDVLRSKVLCQLPNRVIILDGSAKFSCVEWPGFEILELSEHKSIRFDNIKIHPINGNPTKNNIKKSFSDYTKIIFEHLDNNPKTNEVCIISNKESENGLEKLKEYQTFKTELEKRNIKIVSLNRGSVTGSNLAANSEYICVTSSIFDGISSIALRTALRTGSGISADRIWTYIEKEDKLPDGSIIKKIEKLPSMNKGFNDSELNETFRRLFSDEFIQYIMRSRARNYKNEIVHIFAFIPDNWIATELERQLPGIEIPGSDLSKLKELSIEQLENASIKDLAEICGYNGKWNDNTQNEIIRLRDYAYLSKLKENRKVSPIQ